MSKIIIIVLLTALVGTNIFHKWRHDSRTAECMELVGRLQEKSEERDYYEMQYTYNMAAVGMRLDTIAVRDAGRREMPLGEAAGGPTLICRLSDSFCQSCNEYAVEVMRSCMDSARWSDILILYGAESMRTFKCGIEQLGLDGERAYATDTHLGELNDIGFPYFLLVKEGGEVTWIQIPSKNMPELDRKELWKAMKKKVLF